MTRFPSPTVDSIEFYEAYYRSSRLRFSSAHIFYPTYEIRTTYAGSTCMQMCSLSFHIPVYIYTCTHSRAGSERSFEPENFDSITFASIYNIHTRVYMTLRGSPGRLVAFLISNAIEIICISQRDKFNCKSSERSQFREMVSELGWNHAFYIVIFRGVRNRNLD